AMLVAPVKIGAGGTIGAGSTITTSTADGKLVLTRARQTTVEGWSRPAQADPAAQAATIIAALGAEPAKPAK
ncbi:MAG TPA: hypothetical protein VMU86_00480, partial [Steroidobacteraceae bacterium]|nr:hypothetical protein [Steroidobacteraceae bacterium]